MPKVSVIIPVYNSENFIQRTISSVCNQSYKDWELIIIDDGSTDKTKEIVESIQSKEPRIKYIFQDNFGAPARPKNIGIKMAKGEFIAFLDHDDEWETQKLEKQIEILESENSPKLGLIVSDALIISETDGSQKEYRVNPTANYLSSLLERNYIFCSSGVMVKKKVFDTEGYFDENFRFGDDWDMWVRILNSYEFSFLNEPLYKFYRHPNTMTSKVGMEIKIRDYEYGLYKHRKLYELHPESYSNRLLSMGRICYIAGLKVKGLKFLIKSILVNPLNWRSYVNLFFAIFGMSIYLKFVNFRKKINDKNRD